MRICFISLGTFTHIGAYLDYFKQAGHDVHFIAMSPSPERGVPTYNVGLGRRYSETEGKWKYPISMLRAKSLIKKLKPDIVHAHYATSCGLTAMVCGFHPTVVTAHGSDLTAGIQSRLWRPLLRRIFTFADCVNTVSKDLENMAVSLGIDPDKIETLTPGIDTEKFAFTGRRKLNPSQPLRLVCTRRLEPVFDHETIIGAIARLKEKGIAFQMTFVGDGSRRATLSRRAESVGLDGRVSFTGNVPNDELPGILGRHDVYLSGNGDGSVSGRLGYQSQHRPVETQRGRLTAQGRRCGRSGNVPCAVIRASTARRRRRPPEPPKGYRIRRPKREYEALGKDFRRID
jgi:glycosyltransferase involved in cell wall biosynthesis